MVFDETVLRAIFILLLILTPIALVIVIFSPDLRKRTIREAIYLAVTGAAFYFILRQVTPLLRDLGEDAEIDLETIGSTPPVAVPEEFVTNPPEWLSLVFTVLVVVVFGWVAWRIWRAMMRPASRLDLLANEAREAIAEIQSGADLKDTIMRCYFEMSNVLHQERGITRGVAMTPREFETRLKQTGLPGRAIERLTRLFETVRYGAYRPGPAEEAEAISCLTEVVEACRRIG
jgi:hypothetical protein